MKLLGESGGFFVCEVKVHGLDMGTGSPSANPSRGLPQAGSPGDVIGPAARHGAVRLLSLAAGAVLWQNVAIPEIEVERVAVANEEHLARLRQKSVTWNEWRKRNGIEEPDLSEAKLRGADLREADLAGANFGGADLGEANLLRAEV